MKEKNGITLISLIITIVIMLILAGVSISMVIGQNGLFIKTNNANEAYKEKSAKESVSLVIGEWSLENEDNPINLGEFLSGKVGSEIDGIDGEGPYDVEKDGYTFVVDVNGNILNEGKTLNKPVISNIKVVANSDGTGDNIEKSVLEEGTAYITFDAKISNGTIESIEPEVPFPVTKNGDYEFTVTGKLNNETSTSTTKVIVNVNQFASRIDECSWADVNRMSNMIANNTNVTLDTDKTVVTLDGLKYVLQVGDTKKVNGKTVRILGFNHDTLSDSQKSTYNTTTGKAGISFEYTEMLIEQTMYNTTATTSGGWGASYVRIQTRNALNDLSDIKDIVKEVKKTYADGTTSKECTDKLWLLSCSELWEKNQSNFYGDSRVYEGNQYKFYKDRNKNIDASDQESQALVKTNSKGYYDNWLLRSPNTTYPTSMCYVLKSCISNPANTKSNVAPGFSI